MFYPLPFRLWRFEKKEGKLIVMLLGNNQSDNDSLHDAPNLMKDGAQIMLFFLLTHRSGEMSVFMEYWIKAKYFLLTKV